MLKAKVTFVDENFTESFTHGKVYDILNFGVGCLVVYDNKESRWFVETLGKDLVVTGTHVLARFDKVTV
ncbi:hypothetical protein [Escherichia coli]|uniref:hypothetical protein n=1 Tax=Escherichia coli TaxID=562 RepID=UPI000CFC7EF2|nr:hypothetical protein [Escherichia coli]